MSQPFENQTLKTIAARLGRPLRVLHIGNIANNAYNNARIQRQYGVEADVISYDYYHVMSTPEWEDVEFTGDVDADAPDWWSTSLRGWKRPDWFVQGPADACIQYLKARHLGLDKLARLLWTYMEARSLGHVRHLQQAAGKPMTALSWSQMAAIAVVENLGIDKVPTCEGSGLEAKASSTGTLLSQEREWTTLSVPALRSPSRLRNALRPVVRSMIASHYAFKSRLVRGGRELRRRAIYLAAQPLLAFYRVEAVQLSRWTDNEALVERDRAFALRVKETMELESNLGAVDRDRLSDYLTKHPRRFFRILGDYDVVQLYSLDGVIACMNGIKRYCAYEHGTLRELPFENSFYGALTRCAYRHATGVFVTNSDVLPSVARMGLEPARVIHLPHAFDDRKLMRFRAENPGLTPPAVPPVIFSPARQHWKDRSGSWTKGNDILFRAARIVADEGFAFQLHLVAWGRDVEDSKALIAQLGIADKVIWLPTMKKRELWQAYCKAHAVVDQFMLPALGGVAFEAMALGRRLITAIDEAQLTLFFGEAPPCLGAQTVEECAGRLRQIVSDPEDTAGLGLAAQAWMDARHSARRIVDIQAKAYLELILTLNGLGEEAVVPA